VGPWEFLEKVGDYLPKYIESDFRNSHPLHLKPQNINTGKHFQQMAEKQSLKFRYVTTKLMIL
jgi:hypothetical protein